MESKSQRPDSLVLLTAASPRFRRLLLSVIGRAKVQQLGFGVALLSHRAAVILLLDGDALSSEEVRRRAEIYFNEQKATFAQICVVGGAVALAEQLKPLIPWWRQRALLQLSSEGEVCRIKAGFMCKLFGVSKSSTTEDVLNGTPDDLEGLSRSIEDELAERGVDRAEVQAFSDRVQSSTPIVTYGLVGIVVCVFIAQLVTGMDLTYELVAQGALYPPSVFEGGQWWRLLSCTLVHGGLQHALFNTFVLFTLGRFLEPVMGSARFALLYVVSAIAGSAASLMMLGGTVSVGASGAVWGLLCAHAVMAFKPEGLLPSAIVPGAKRAAMINLGLNLFVSFLPNIDMWAHFGGGLAGALVFLAMRSSFQGEAKDAAFPMRALAFAGVVALVSASAFAFYSRPAQDLDSPIVRDGRFAVPESIAGLTPFEAAPVGGPSARYGDIMREPIAIDFYEFGALEPGTPLPDAEAIAFSEVARELEAAGVHFDSVITPRGRGVLMSRRNEAGDVLNQSQLFFVRDDLTLVRMDVVTWKEVPPPRGLLLQLADENLSN